MRRSPLSRTLLALLAGAFPLLLAGSASALPTTYAMVSGSRMSTTNIVCVPCTVPVTGSITLDDDGAGNVALTNVSLAHDAYEIALPGFVSIVLERSSIALAAGSVSGTGSTQTSVAFGSTTLAHVGTVTCVSEVVTCTSTLGIPDGTYPLPGPVTVNLGTWTFDGLGGFSASFVYLSRGGANPTTETMHLVGSTAAIPEPGTGLLVAAGLAAVARRRARTRAAR